MTLRTLAQAEARGFTWVDLVDPTPAVLDAVAAEYGLHATSVRDCLDPEHLPKFEKLPGGSFAIIRGYDEQERDGETLHEITRKVAIFAGPGVLVTVHRRDQPYLHAAMDEVLTRLPLNGAAPAGAAPEAPEAPLLQVTVGLMQAAADSFTAPLDRLEERLDREEARVFEQRDFVGTLREIHRLKRRAAVLKRLLWHTLATVQRVIPASERAAPWVQELRETTESLYAFADELVEDAGSVLEVPLALASHRTNEVVRVLTLFSAFFLPLTFIVGIYGMNFDVLPELRWRYGYPAVMALMGAVVLGIYAWFRKQGWLQR